MHLRAHQPDVGAQGGDVGDDVVSSGKGAAGHEHGGKLLLVVFRRRGLRESRQDPGSRGLATVGLEIQRGRRLLQTRALHALADQIVSAPHLDVSCQAQRLSRARHLWTKPCRSSAQQEANFTEGGHDVPARDLHPELHHIGSRFRELL